MSLYSLSTPLSASAAPATLAPVRAGSLRQMLGYQLTRWAVAAWRAAEAWGQQRADAEMRRHAWRLNAIHSGHPPTSGH